MCVLQLLCDGSEIASILNEFSQSLERKKNLWDRQVGELSVVSYCSELTSGELQHLEFSKSCRQDLEFSKSCWQDLEYSNFCRQDFEFSKSCRTRVNLVIFKIFIAMSNCVRILSTKKLNLNLNTDRLTTSNGSMKT